MEVWKDVVGFEGLYQISNYGRIMSFHRDCKPLSNKKNGHGYLWVDLYTGNGDTPCHVLVHRLVAKHFIENPENLPIINHKDENPENNHVENLEWCTNSYNIRYSLLRRGRTNRTIRKIRTNHAKRVPNIPIAQYDKKGVLIRIWDSCIKIKHEWGKNESSVRQCCDGKRKTAYGFKWALARYDTPQENAV
jgi:hypothetical protein